MYTLRVAASLATVGIRQLTNVGFIPKRRSSGHTKTDVVCRLQTLLTHLFPPPDKSTTSVLDINQCGSRKRTRKVNKGAGTAPQNNVDSLLQGRVINQIAYVREQNSVALPRGSVEVVSRSEILEPQRWAKAFGAEAKDRRYYELVEDTIHEEFDYRYFIIRDEIGEIRAIQPFFMLDLDLLVGIKPQFGWLTDCIRRLWPGFMRTRTLMVGCAAGEGHLDGKDERARRSSTRLLAQTLVKQARNLKARLVVLKEFPAKYRSVLECFVDHDFSRIPSLPNVMLNIDYASFEEYMQRALSGNARKKLRQKLRASEQADPIEMIVVDDIAPMIDEVYPLYLQVYHRSGLHFEKLTKDYFCGLGTRLGDKNRFFIWRQNGKIIAFGCCLLHGDTIHAEYLGLDYPVALDLHMYHCVFRDLISWGIAGGYKWFHSSALNYDPKFHLRYRLDPLDLYVRHTSTVCNAILRRILPWIEPTRYDKTLKKFANYDELWAPTVDRPSPWTAAALAAVSQGKDAIASAFAWLHHKFCLLWAARQPHSYRTMLI
ncbi:MAG TPA: GNAT family N-acetyltransferase [Xanthobacteraceae bacterium]|nr:GNAT family N-acetyltransferase [Xanthobacteraceae bacterium]